MSRAGIQSNRGDGYQTLVAFDWALTVLSDTNYQWLEVDSVTWPVDDVVVGKVDGAIICCQCKKNQPLNKPWAIADLADELRKAIALLASNSRAEVRFYSRSAFGDLAALREYSANYADESTYRDNLSKVHRTTDSALGNLLVEQEAPLSTYQFLQRTIFEVTPELDRMRSLLQERLRRLASNHSAAFDTLWTRLDHLGMRMSDADRNVATQHRLSKGDLKSLLDRAGSILAPPVEMADIRNSFKSVSAVGRSWRRDICNECISSPALHEIMAAIEARHGSVLLTGLPGSGKTCVMLAAQDALEQLAHTRSDIQPLFIQSREFSNLSTVQDRQAMGLSAQWVERAARLAEDAHVVVMIDSLDVLSIAREHGVLTYFLAQIDRLLLIPNITVVTACRDFDCHYDRRIAQRNWGKKITCQPLGWDTDITPLLAKLDIDSSAIDTTTRELIRNPRELALFVELAQHGGSFNAVTSQALAQRYLATIVQANSSLGETAMQAIEAIATEMLNSRSLAVPRQRFPASQDIQRALLSNNVLHETQDGQLTFGHQTLLDVLVISGAVRQAVTLNVFIQQLPPVPFVRPSIRSFVAQLAARDRRELRKQLRTVLTGNSAFHIRRLVAETFADQAPCNDDWPLMRDLHSRHRELFQAIYLRAARVEWHYFWMEHLVPMLRETRDIDGLVMHGGRISQWQNDDPSGVTVFWAEVLRLDEARSRLTYPIARAITQIHIDHLASYSPLLVEILKFPRQSHGFLGESLARCVESGHVDDAELWRYIVGEISDNDACAYRFNQKLHCQPHEFGSGNEKFLKNRMVASTALLDLAVSSLEHWSWLRNSHYGEATTYRSDFLGETSYEDSHSQNNLEVLDSERILMDAVEAAIVHHASTESIWWKNNRERLCFNPEGSLRYFAILACTALPNANLDVIGHMLCDKVALESTLSYELGTMMQVAFFYLDESVRDTVQQTLLILHFEEADDPQHHAWMLQEQAKLILAIPCHLRSKDAQAVLNECEKRKWPQTRNPDILGSSGIVSAPFSFEVFLDVSDDGVLRLLGHYKGFVRNYFDDLLVGGESEVGSQLYEAASRHPLRFLSLLSEYWEHISDRFRNDLMSGVAAYLAYRYGNLHPNSGWSPRDEPDAVALAQEILNELERHPNHWRQSHAASKAIESCAAVLKQARDAARLVSLATEFSTLQEEDPISGDSVGLIELGVNMTRGNAAEALMILANQLQENGIEWPESLPGALRRFAADEHPAIRALLLRRMPYLQSHHPELGWELFGISTKQHARGLWSVAEPCLYYAYHQQFEIVAPWLTRLYHEGSSKDFETWGRISALAALSGKLELSTLFEALHSAETAEAWRGAASVWTHAGNLHEHREQCFSGVEAGLNAEEKYAIEVARKLCNLFREATPLPAVPIDLIRRCFCLLETETEAGAAQREISRFDAWLNASSLRDPIYALDVAEIYLDFVKGMQLHLFDSGNHLTQFLTRLFAQAEEQEESDGGAMLQRVVAMQDVLLALGVSGVNEWLKAAERP